MYPNKRTLASTYLYGDDKGKVCTISLGYLGFVSWGFRLSWGLSFVLSGFTLWVFAFRIWGVAHLVSQVSPQCG